MADDGWTCTIDATSTRAAFSDDEINRLADLFLQQGGSVTVGGEPGRLGATFSIKRNEIVRDNQPTPIERVATRAVQIFHQHLRAIGPEKWTLVRVDVRTDS